MSMADLLGRNKPRRRAGRCQGDDFGTGSGRGRPLEAFEVSGGDRELRRSRFCARCGSRLFNPVERGDELVEVRIGSLDEAPFELRPQAEIWVTRRESWIPPVDGAAQYDENRR
jgi:hypothetical protein